MHSEARPNTESVCILGCSTLFLAHVVANRAEHPFISLSKSREDDFTRSNDEGQAVNER